MASFAPIRGTRAQIQATPIVDGQFLVETDQGVDNMIYMDEGSTRTIVGGNTITGVLPELYIYSETGSVVTVEDAGGTTIPTSQIGTDHWICEVPDYGIYTVYSVLSGETTTKSINVDDCMIYTIDDSHFHCNIEVTYPSGVGATCTISGGGETYSAPALNPPDTSYKFVVHGKNTTYTITTNVDGSTKTEYVATGTTLDQTYQITMPYARINLTVEAPPITGNITCTDGTTTITRPVSPTMTLYVPNIGTWTISGSDGVNPPYTVEVEITSLSDVVDVDLSTVPDGSTVTPTDDIQTLLKCANIRNKTSYTTLDDVLNDDETLQKVICSNNAIDYLVRSKTFATAVDGLVPQLSSATPNVTVSSNYTSQAISYPYKVFDQDWDETSLYPVGNCWLAPTGSTNQWIAYEFDTATTVRAFKIRAGVQATGAGATGVYTSTYNSSGYKEIGLHIIKVQYSDTGSSSDWIDVDDGTQFTIFNDQPFTFSFGDNGSHKFWRIMVLSSVGSIEGVANLQWYGTVGITNNERAMRYIGRSNYASNKLLSDSDWVNSISTSPFCELVLNKKVPTMTGYTTPEGEAFCSSTYTSNAYYGWYAFAGYRGQTAHSSGRWCSAQNQQTSYIGYEFTTPVAVNKIVMLNQGESPANNIPLDYTGVIEYYDGTTWQPAHSFSASRQNASINRIITFDNTVAATKWRVYFNSYVIQYTSGNFTEVAELQFYGRVDVTEGLAIYSAADDVVTIFDGTNTITATTDSTGLAVLTTPLTEGGIYSFTSSVANNPDNTSVFYSKSNVTIYKNRMVVMVMPDNVLYWYGFIGGNCDYLTKDTGWSYSSHSFTKPTYNLRNVKTNTSSSNTQGIGNIIPVQLSTLNALTKGVTLSGNFAGTMNARQTKPDMYTNYTQIGTNTSITKYSHANTFSSYPNEGLYIDCESNSGRAMEIYAFWYDE